MDNTKIVLKIVEGDEYRSRIGSIYAENTFFRSVYLQAGRCVREIIHNSEKFDAYWHQNCSKITAPAETAMSLHGELASYPNNIIAFCGQRGQGKTSAMISFSKALENLRPRTDHLKEIFWSECMEEDNAWTQWGFIVIDPVDPTSMEQTDSILRILLSRMFVRFRDFCDAFSPTNKSHDLFATQMNKVLDDFRDCYKTLDTLKEKQKEEYYYDDLSSLADLGDSSCMKKKMTQLVHDFCTFLGGTQKKRDILVLQLDDTDLNVQHAYEILEDIRKYLVIPGVIILIATELTQLSLIVEQHFVNGFKALTDYSKLQLSDQDTLERMNCHNSAENYIGKLFPSMHQIHLPTLDEIVSSAHSQIDLYYENADGKTLLEPQTENQDNAFEYQKILLTQIYQKTRIVLLEPRSFLQNLLPSTMRQLTHFLTVLKEMPNIDPDISLQQIIAKESESAQNNQRRLLRNLDQLAQYFRFEWCPIHLTTLENMEMQKIFSVSRSFLHQQVMLSLRKITNPKQTDENSEQQRYLYRDVLETIRQLRQSRERERFYKICFAVEFYYTIINYQRLITGQTSVCALQADAEAITQPQEDDGGTTRSTTDALCLVFEGDSLNSLKQTIDQQDPDSILLKNLIISGCIAWRDNAESGAVEITAEELLHWQYNRIRFDPQYLLFVPKEDQPKVDPTFMDGAETTPQAKTPKDDDKRIQKDAKMIYWASPELQNLFYKTSRSSCQPCSNAEQFCKAVQKSLEQFSKKLNSKTDRLPQSMPFDFDENTNMRKALTTLYNAHKKMFIYRNMLLHQPQRTHAPLLENKSETITKENAQENTANEGNKKGQQSSE